jgi:hypothetical protein
VQITASHDEIIKEKRNYQHSAEQNEIQLQTDESQHLKFLVTLTTGEN